MRSAGDWGQGEYCRNRPGCGGDRGCGIRLKDFGEKVTIVRSNYRDMKSQLQKLGIDKVDGIVLDLGVSSYQLDTQSGDSPIAKMRHWICGWIHVRL